MVENVQRLYINNEIVRFKPDSLKIMETTAPYKARASQDGASVTSSNFFDGNRLWTVSFETINNAESRRVLNLIGRNNDDIIDISISTDDVEIAILNAGRTEALEQSFSSEGDITGFAFTGVQVVSRKQI